MSDSRALDLQNRDVTSSGSYRQDVVNAVRYALIGAVFLGIAAINFDFLDTVRGRTAAAEFFSSFGPVTPSMGVDIAYLAGYVILGLSVLSFLMVAYSGVVRPLQRARGLLDSAGTASTDGPRAPISVETTDGTQVFEPDAVCVDCEERAIGVLSTDFEESTPGTVVPVCPMHLHERRDEYEDRSQRVDAETFV